jgi:hypothetical protein
MRSKMAVEVPVPQCLVCTPFILEPAREGAASQEYIRDDYDPFMQLLKLSSECAFDAINAARAGRDHSEPLELLRSATEAFLDQELSRLFADMAVCTAGPACGPSGGTELLDALAAFRHALGLAVAVRPGPCEGVCPKNGVVVRCPDQALRVCGASSWRRRRMPVTYSFSSAGEEGRIPKRQQAVMDKSRTAGRMLE